MREIMIIFIIMSFFCLLFMSSIYCISFLSMAGAYMNSGDIGLFDLLSMNFINYIKNKVEYEVCKATHTFSVGGVVGADSQCSDPDGLKIPGGGPCPEGNNKDCKSGHCDCTFPSKTGDSCFCRSTGDETDLKKKRGESCSPDDHDVCASGECRCAGAMGLGLIKSNCECT